MTHQPFAHQVRDGMWELLSARYRTNRRDGWNHSVDEYVGHRPFWPEFIFDDVGVVTESGPTRIRVTFHESDHPETILGFRIDLEPAMEAWSIRVGGRDPRQHPEMFAAELVWFMVCFIGVADFGPDVPGTLDDPQWINTGAEIFGKLRNNPNMESFESHH